MPNTTFFTDLMERFRLQNEIVDERVVGYKTETDIWTDIGDLDSRSFILIFDDTAPDKKFRYTIRSKSNHFQTDQQYSKNLPGIATKVFNEYISDGFSGLQLSLDFTYFDLITNRPGTEYRIELERLPSPAHEPIESKLDKLGLYFIIFSVFICISLIFTRIVEEKACGFREQLKNATRYSFLNNIALFSVNHLQMLLLFYICLLITYFKGFWFSVNVFYPVLLIAFFVTSIICFTFFVSAFFESSKLFIFQISTIFIQLFLFSCVLYCWSRFLVFCSILLLSVGHSSMEENPYHISCQCILSRNTDFPRLHKLGSLLLPSKLLSTISPERRRLCYG